MVSIELKEKQKKVSENVKEVKVRLDRVGFWVDSICITVLSRLASTGKSTDNTSTLGPFVCVELYTMYDILEHPLVVCYFISSAVYYMNSLHSFELLCTIGSLYSNVYLTVCKWKG